MVKLNGKIAYTILYKMFFQKIWKSNHIRFDNLKHCGFPKNKLGEVEKTIEGLIKLELIIYYNKSKKALQLNWNKRFEIMKIIEEEKFDY